MQFDGSREYASLDSAFGSILDKPTRDVRDEELSTTISHATENNAQQTESQSQYLQQLALQRQRQQQQQYEQHQHEQRLALRHQTMNGREQFASPVRPNINRSDEMFYGTRKRDAFKILIVALTISLGMSVFWLAKHTFQDIYLVECACPSKKLIARACLPLLFVVVLWAAKVWYSTPTSYQNR